MSKLRAGIVGATGMVGQRFITLIENHPYFEISALIASPSSAGKTYGEAVKGRWKMKTPLSDKIANMQVLNAEDIESVKPYVDFVFCAVNMPKAEIKALEEAYAKAEIPVISNNSANRGTADVPMLIPEINYAHSAIIESQKKRLGTKKGFISVKPNCSIQSYVPALEPLRKFGIKAVNVTTFQAISGAGKTFDTWPEMVDNVIPYIGGEEEKSEKEPLKVWGTIEGDAIVPATSPVISAQCIRVPVADGHLAAVSVSFENKPSIEEIKKAWAEYVGEAQRLELPLAPAQFLTYFEEDNRPQTNLDRDLYGGMGISIGRLREDTIFDYKFVCLSHNTLRGAAGGAVLGAELLYRQGYLY
ncbi:MAG: aspartate-semialdehyde dehydrogenase [Clostridia bacterium]|nr:aspartate-semialdehyde dehydrogenase [Clostridia bacterium]MBR6754407.1 aspartate-semialdehyde dehydrogenase [Clostridia bacterium]